MTPEEGRRNLIVQFCQNNTKAMEITGEEYRLCFPDVESLINFRKTSGLHIHINKPEFGDTILLSTHEDPFH